MLSLTLLSVTLLAYEPYNKNGLGFEVLAETDPIVSPYNSTNEEIVAVKMVSEDAQIVPGKPFWVAFQFHMADDWHLYWLNPGDAGQAPSVHWLLPPGFKVADLIFPAPQRFEIDQSVVYGYSKHLTILAEINPPKELEVGSNVDIKADISWFGCSTSCVPGQAAFNLNLPVAATQEAPSRHVVAIFKQARNALPHPAGSTKAAIKDNNILEMRVHQDMPFVDVTGVSFFLEEPNIIATKEKPSWQLSSDKKTIIVRIQGENFLEPQIVYPLRGMLVVEEKSSLGPLKSSWSVSIPKPKNAPATSVFEQKYQVHQQKQATNVEEHLEELESKVWYRRMLTEFTLFLKSEFAKILLWAFVGGIILNVMPCVLPVISFKLLHFVQLQGYSRLSIAKHGIMYSFGVLISFWILSATIYILQSFGHVIGWGFQLQEPIFVTLMIIVLFILALSLFGVFEFGVSVSSTTGAWEQSFTKRIPSVAEAPSYTSSFVSGVLATFVAAPCTGPLLGSAIGFAATLQPTYSFAIFSALGLGMAFPFLLVSLFPGLTKFLPKPGRWMLTFKQLMGFFMLATVLWLVWVLDAQTMGLSNLKLSLSLFIIAFGVWVYGTWGGLDRSRRIRLAGRLIALAFIVGGSWYFIANVHRARTTAQQQIEKEKLPASQVVGEEWETFSLPSLERYVQKGVPVFVDVTAKWCLTCQTNKLVLESAKVREAFVKYGVVKMLADWTMNDKEITQYIRSVGRNGVPVYALYSPEHSLRPVILPEVLTQDMVIDALKKVREQEKKS
jgi:thiol:disulfide interchange protein DsbD